MNDPPGPIRAGDVHPVAALFPMLPEDELADMAADIAERGLLQPIVRDSGGLILDGRNRLAACKIAKVKPRFETYDGDDPAGYALAANIVRRSLTKGQAAMIAAQAMGLSGNLTVRGAADLSGINRDRIHRASVVLRYAPALAGAVVSGAVGLDAAFEKAQIAKGAAEGEEAQLERLRQEDPELAARVNADGPDRLSLAGAQAELKARAEQRRRDAVAYRTVICEPARALAQLFAGQADADAIAARISGFPDVFEGYSPTELEAAADGLSRIASGWRKHAEEAH